MSDEEKVVKFEPSSATWAGLLLLLFVTLKLTHTIDWSWVWVVSPIWIPFAFAGVLAVGYILADVVYLGFSYIKRKVLKK